jgi:hypothetical protein
MAMRRPAGKKTDPARRAGIGPTGAGSWTVLAGPKEMLTR